jgi:hypothetical protein
MTRRRLLASLLLPSPPPLVVTAAAAPAPTPFLRRSSRLLALHQARGHNNSSHCHFFGVNNNNDANNNDNDDNDDSHEICQPKSQPLSKRNHSKKNKEAVPLADDETPLMKRPLRRGRFPPSKKKTDWDIPKQEKRSLTTTPTTTTSIQNPTTDTNSKDQLLVSFNCLPRHYEEQIKKQIQKEQEQLHDLETKCYVMG